MAQASSLNREDIPAGSNWYVHINLDLIQNSEVGRSLMLETADEVLNEIREELDVDVRQEILGITVFGSQLPNHGNRTSDGAVILHGGLSAATQDALMAAIERKGVEVGTMNSAGLTYYQVSDNDEKIAYTDENGQVRDIEWGDQEELYFSFGPAQTLITQNLELMHTFLQAGANLGGFEVNATDALLVLQADRALLQGGANTSNEMGGDWDSSVLKNVDAVALVIAEDMGGLQIDAHLMANSADVAMSVRNIAEGLVALKALDESEGVFGEILRQVRFENDGSTLKVNVTVAADQVEALRDEL